MNLRDVTQLTPKDVRAWVNQLRTGTPDPKASYRTPNPSRGRQKEPGWLRKPLSPKSIHNPHGLLFSICEAAVREDPPIQPSNPAARTRQPRADHEADTEMCFLTREEFTLLRDSMHPDVRDMIEVFVRTGMRYSELVALQVRDGSFTPTIDHDGQQQMRGHLDVRRAWKRQPDNAFHLEAPKTRSSRRRLPLSPRTIDLLRPRLEGKKPEEFVFTTDQGSWWRHSSFYGRRWAPGVREAQRRGLGKKPRIHDLRHGGSVWLRGCVALFPLAVDGRIAGTSVILLSDARHGPASFGVAVALLHELRVCRSFSGELLTALRRLVLADLEVHRTP